MRMLTTITRLVLLIVVSVEFVRGCSWDYEIWIPRSPDADPLYKFVVKTEGDKFKAGYIDRNGKIVIPPSLDPGSNGGDEFHSGLLLLGVASGAYIDSTGRKVLDTGFYRNWDFSEGLAVAMEKDKGKFGYINTEGQFQIASRFDAYPKGYVHPFSDGFAMIEVSERVGYIDPSGRFAIPPAFLEGTSFHEGFARVVVEGPCAFNHEQSVCPDFGVLPKSAKSSGRLPACKYTFIDKSGRVISPERYDYALNFSEGLAPVRIGRYWGYVDKSGGLVIPPKFDSAKPFSEGLALVSQDKLFGYIDRNGVFAIKPQFLSGREFHDGRAVVGYYRTGYWYIDSNGNRAFDGIFEAASEFFKGLAHVRLKADDATDTDRYAYIDREGKVIFSYDQ